MSDWVTPNLHGRLGEWYQKGLETKPSYQLIMLPRGHLKTTMFSIGNACWRATNDPNIRILLVMSSTRTAIQKVQKMQRVILSDLYRHFWPERIPNTNEVTWQKSAFEIARTANHEEPTVTGIGAESSLVGGHYDVIDCDDLVEDTKRASTAVQMENALNFFQLVEGLWVRRDRSDLTVVGTYWLGPYYDALMTDPLSRKVILGAEVDERFVKWEEDQGFACTLEMGSPICPELEKPESLERARIRMQSNYAGQMLNLRVTPEHQRFKQEDLRYMEQTKDWPRQVDIDGTVIPVKGLYRQLVIDPATGRGRDTCANVVTGWSREEGVLVVLDAWEGKVWTKAHVQKTLEMAKQWDVHVIRPEEAAYQTAFIDFLNDEMTRFGRRFAVVPCRPKSVSKADRIIKGLEGYVGGHQVYFRRDQPALPTQLVNLVIVDGLVRGASPNLVDALAYSTEYCRRMPRREPLDDIMFIEEEQATRPSKSEEVRYGLRCETRLQLALHGMGP